MNQDEREAKEQRLNRQKRVNRIKKMIIGSVLGIILLLFLLIIMLFFKVHSLQIQIKELYALKQEESMKENTFAYNEFNRSNELKSSAFLDFVNLQYQFKQLFQSGTRDDKQKVQKTEKPTEPDKGATEDTAGKIVYLTFDDGPSSNTLPILDILDRYQVKATFFVNGREDEHSKAMYKEIVKRGHTLAMHTYSHKYDVVYDSLENFDADLMKLQNYLYDLTGVRCRLFRFPGGSSNTVSKVPMTEFIKYLNEKGIIYFDWNVSSGDASSKELSVDVLVNNVMKDVGRFNKSVVLMHDTANKQSTVDALPIIIEQLQAQNIRLEALTEQVQPVQHIQADKVN